MVYSGSDYINQSHLDDCLIPLKESMPVHFSPIFLLSCLSNFFTVLITDGSLKHKQANVMVIKLRLWHHPDTIIKRGTDVGEVPQEW